MARRRVRMTPCGYTTKRGKVCEVDSPEGEVCRNHQRYVQAQQAPGAKQRQKISETRKNRTPYRGR
jgi:hypothetical protein